MKKTLLFVALMIVMIAPLSSCLKNNNNYDKYKDWKEVNDAWVLEQISLTNPDGTPYYTAVTSPSDRNAHVYVHYFNDRSATVGNLSPLYTSVVDVKYIGRLYNYEAFDSSFRRTNPDSIFRTKVGGGIIEGWRIVLQDMRVQDSCRVIIPYYLAYGAAGQGNISPYSALQFDIKLVDINKYEIK